LAAWWDLLTAIEAPPEDFVWVSRVLGEGVQVVPADVEVEIAHLKNYPSAQTFHEPLQEYLEEEVRE